MNKCVTLIVLGAGLIMTGHAVLTPLLQALAMLAGDIVTMSRAADRARPTPYPNAWRVRNMTLAGIPLGAFKLAYCIGVLAAGWYGLRLMPDQMRTLTLAMLVFAGQANVYVLRERGPFWSSRPAPVMLCASLADVGLIALLAVSGLLVTPLAPSIVGLLLLATCGFGLALDLLKRLVFVYLDIDRREMKTDPNTIAHHLLKS